MQLESERGQVAQRSRIQAGGLGSIEGCPLDLLVWGYSWRAGGLAGKLGSRGSGHRDTPRDL